MHVPFNSLRNIKMYLSFNACACLCLILAICHAWAPGTEPKRGPSFSAKDIKRGLAAEQYLLGGAELALYESERLILYTKDGNLQKALHDFRFMLPQNVQYKKGPDSGLMKGAVGDRDIALYIGQNLYPQITLTKFDSNFQPHSKTIWYIGALYGKQNNN